MTVTASLARRLAVAALVLSTIAAAMIAALVVSATPSAAMYVPTDAERAERIADREFLEALVGSSTDLTPTQARRLLRAADGACALLAIDVPLVHVADAYADALGLTDEESRHLVNTAGVMRCPAA